MIYHTIMYLTDNLRGDFTNYNATDSVVKSKRFKLLPLNIWFFPSFCLHPWTGLQKLQQYSQQQCLESAD